MNIKHFFAAFGLAMVSTGASAITVFSDDFNSENGSVPVLNYAGFSNWTVSNGTVDLIGNGYFDFLPGNGLYIDLDGSTQDAGIMTHSQNLAAGNYILYFDLAGNQRNTAPESTAIDVILTSSSLNLASLNVSLSTYDPFQTYALGFSLGSSGWVDLTFGGAGQDNIGMLLDNVWLDYQPRHDLPEPSSLLLIGLGLLGVGAARRKAA